MRSVILFLLLIGISWSLSFYGETRFLWGIPVTVLVYGDDPVKAVDLAFSEMVRVGGRLNYYSETSEVTKINRNAGRKPVEVSPVTLRTLLLALKVSKITGGAFDPTVGPLLKLWDFRRGIVPDERSIKKALRKVDYRKVRVEKEGRIYLEEEGMELHLGGIVKGAMVDSAVELLEKAGAVAGLVAAGGDVRVFGKRPDGRPWRVGVKDPRGEGVIAVIELSKGAVSTAGDYVRFFLKNHRRYHHILDPRTGFPARGVASVTVIAPSSALADALSTGLFVLGEEKAFEILKKLRLEGIVITTEGKMKATEGIRGSLLTPEPPVEVNPGSEGEEEDSGR